MRVVRGSKVCRVLSSVRRVHLRRLHAFSQENESIHIGHVVASLKDLKRGGPKSIPSNEAPPTKCPDHNEQMKIFCFDCNCLICRDCTIIDHNGHNFNFLKKCAPESRKTLRDSLAPLRKVQADIARAEKKLNATEAQVDTQKNEVCKSLEQSFDHLKALLDQRKVELVKKAIALAQEKKCSGSSEEGAASGPGRTPEPGGVCGAERGEYERPRSDGHPHTTADQGGGGRETTSSAVSGASHQCRHLLQPSLP